MIKTPAYAAAVAKAPLAHLFIERREPGPHDVLIEILYCGVCHSDIHQVRDEWASGIFPMVPGHEIVGRIAKVGDKVTRFKVGDLAGIGCFIDSCRECPECKAGLEQYCQVGLNFTYNSREKDGKTPTHGGYSTRIVVDEQYTLHVSPKLPLEGVAPLLCAGITTYSPLRHWKVGKGQKVGVLGLGGLGHMAVKFAVSFGAEVMVFSTSPSKQADAKRLGAHDFALTSHPGKMKSLANRFDFLIDAISAPHDYAAYLDTLKTDGVMVCVGVPTEAMSVPAFSIIPRRRSVAGSMIGGIQETQEMLDYCAAHNITSDVEVIPIQQINDAYERVIKGQVKYRFVIDIASLK
jgi:uncharacterized zinc-type alcohol dehydrogenase-like protein